MRNRLIPLALPIAAALVVSPVAAAPGRPATAAMAATALPAVVQVATGRGRLITLAQPMSDLFVADDNIADVQVRSPTQLYVFGKKGGETTISATAKGGGVVFSATVRVGNNFDSIGQMLGLAMPEAHVVATPMNGLVLLTGTVAAPEDAAEAERLVQAFVGDTVKVITRLKTATPLQVNLQVRIAEVSRSFIKNVGVNLMSHNTASGSGFQFGIAQGRGAATQYAPGGDFFTGGTSASTGTSLITQAATGSTFGFAGKLLGLDLIGAIDLGETTGQVTTLANPNLTALSGETGTFLAGGEVPIPIAQGLGAVSVEYKQYGVGLSYTPTVLSDGRISLRVKPEVSQLDYSNAVTLNGTRVPGLTTRRTETTVELGSGQSMMISGLLSNSHNNSIDKAPGLGDLPIIGALFRSNSWQRNETELVIIITPYLVKPVNNQRDIALPSDGYKAPTDLGRVLMGDLAKGTSGGQRPVPTAAPMETNPTIGAAASVPVVPAPPARSAAADARRDQPEAKPQAKSAKPLPAPGFSE